jgi:two-component system cell cycle sensor histidine kinase/response regulator CckA
MKKKIVEILLFVFIFSAFSSNVNEEIEEVFHSIVYILFGVLLFLFFKKNKENKDFTLYFRDFFSYNSIFYCILNKKNEIVYFDERNHKKVNEFLEKTDNLIQLLKHLNLSKEHIEMINLFLSRNENLEINADYELKNVYSNVLIPYFKIVLIYDEKSKTKILFFAEDNNKNLLKVANYHNLSFFKISHEKNILDENDLAKKIDQDDKEYIFSLVDKNFIQYDERNIQNRQNQFLYINHGINYLISIFEKIFFDIADMQIKSKFLILVSESNENNFWHIFFSENFIPIAEMNDDFQIVRSNKKMGEILRFLSDKRNNFFDFFDIKNVHGGEKQFLQNELNQKKEILQSAMLKFDSNDEFLLFFQKIENSIFVYIVESNASKDLDLSFNHSQKMQVIGNLASGIAHDFNNLLTGMVGFCDLLIAKHSSDKESLSMFIHIKQNIVRAMDLIRKLLTFSKKQLTKIEVIDVKKVIINVVDLLKRIIGENIELNLKYSDEQLLTKIDQSQFEQMIINLVVNARDSIEKNGQINIELNLVDIVNDDYKIHPYLKIYSPDGEKIDFGLYILIKIEDNGIGIDESKASKIFEPFYTTKDHGSGLGLSMIYGALKNANGYIFFTTEKGSTFYLLLRKYDGVYENNDVRQDSEVNFLPKLKENYKIVLIEDESSVRSFIDQAFDKSHHKIISFDSSESALKFLNDENKDEIHLIITDVMMPKINGYDFMNEIKANKKYEKTKFLFISGYMESKIIQDLQNEIAKYEFLAKPFTLKQLLQKVEEILSTMN